MSQFVSSVFEASFDAMVKQAYQSSEKLAGTTREKHNIVGLTHQFPVMGKGISKIHVPITNVVPMNITYTPKVLTLKNYDTPEYSSIFDLEKISFDEKSELAQSVAMAMGRSWDQIRLDAMIADFGATVLTSVGGAGTGFVLEKILRAKRILDDNGVPENGRHIAMSAGSLETALQETEISSSDFNVVKSLVNGDLKKFSSFTFHLIETRSEGGLPITGTVRDNFAWHKDAVGFGTGIQKQTKIDWIPEKVSWLINGIFSADAVTVDNKGVVKIQTEETPI